jgi:small subunit ribosomal protein S16
MAVKIRLQRGGAAHAPHYRIVVAESRFRRDGRFIEVIGRYNPVAKYKSEKCTLELDRADHWISVGAQPSDTVRGLINRVRRGFYEPSEEELAKKAAPAPTPAPAPAPEAKAEEPVAEAPAEEPKAEAEEQAEAGDEAKDSES